VTPVLPLQAIACGLIVVLFDVNVGVDLVPDPLGWAAVFYGAGRLPAAFAQRSALVALAAVAGAISVLQWIPGLSLELEGPAEILVWLLALPDLAFYATLAVGMRGAAISAGDGSAASWWERVLVGLVLAVLLLFLVYGTEAPAVGVLAVVTAIGTVVTIIVLCFRHARRPWIDGPLAPADR
jgi:hypothetical protein